MEDGLDERITPNQARLISKEIEQQIGSGALVAVVAFWIAHFFRDGPNLGWWWLAHIPLSIVVSTLLIGSPMLVFAVWMGGKRTDYTTGNISALKAAGCALIVASLPVGWFTAKFIADWIE